MKILLAGSKELVNRSFAATVEAEYGDFCIEGTKVTLAHHGSRSNNPAPCCWDKEIPQLEKDDEILISHVDLDTIGGCLDLMGKKPECPDFWKAAAYVDVNGPHHMYELSAEQQNMLNAYYAWNAVQERLPRFTEITDVTEEILKNLPILERIVAKDIELLEDGKWWKEETTATVEAKLIKESDKVRAFITDRVFCSASYYSPNMDKVIPATVVMNTTMKAITIAFEDGGKIASAVDIVQKLWGKQAGGRAGIAGSPRGWEITDDELQRQFERAVETVENLL